VQVLSLLFFTSTKVQILTPEALRCVPGGERRVSLPHFRKISQYKSTNTDTSGTKVLILTPAALRARRREEGISAAFPENLAGACSVGRAGGFYYSVYSYYCVCVYICPRTMRAPVAWDEPEARKLLTLLEQK
jgi:hypothetical protein